MDRNRYLAILEEAKQINQQILPLSRRYARLVEETDRVSRQTWDELNIEEDAELERLILWLDDSGVPSEIWENLKGSVY